MPAFAYTIGLHGIGHPELLVFGLGFEPAKTLLTRLAHEVRDHGAQLVMARHQLLNFKHLAEAEYRAAAPRP